jgi:microcompartment protein CcmK/EutM
MRIGTVIGRVTLAHRLENVAGGRFLVIWPQDLGALRGEHDSPAKPVVAYDELNPGLGARVAFTEGREAAAAFGRRPVPIEAYVSAILDHVHVAD